MKARRSPRIGLLVGLESSGKGGLRDPADLVSWFALRVARAELRRRLPGAEILALTLDEVASPLDGGDQVHSVAPWTPERRSELAAQLDCVGVVSPEREGAGHGDWPPADGLGADHESACPSLTLEAGLLCQLLPEVFDERVLEARLAWLRLIGCYPASGRAVVLAVSGLAVSGLPGSGLDGCGLDGSGRAGSAGLGALLAVSEAIAPYPDAVVVVLGGPPVDLSLLGNVVSLPRVLSLEDVAAVIRASSVVVGTAPGVEDLALAYQRPFVVFDPASPNALADALGASLDLEGVGGESSDSAAARSAPWAPTLLDALANTASRASRSKGSANRPKPSPAGTPGPEALAGLERVAQRTRERQLLMHRRLLAEQGASLVEAGAREAAQRAAAQAAATEVAAYRAEIEGRLAELRRAASEGYRRWEADVAALRADLVRYRVHVAALESERDGLVEAVARVEGACADLERELVATHATALFRYAAGPRRIYGALRRRLA